MQSQTAKSQTKLRQTKSGSSLNLSDILTALPGLLPNELEEVQKALKAISALTGHKLDDMPSEPARIAQSDADFVLELIVKITANLSIDYCSLKQLQKSHHFKSFNMALPKLMEFVRKADSRKLHQKIILSVGIELLCESLKELNIPASGSVILSQIHRIPSLLDRAFPGYAAAGMLSMIVTAERKHK